MTQEIIKVLGIFAPELLTKYLNARSKKDKVCHFILDYILARGAVDGVSVVSRYYIAMATEITIKFNCKSLLKK